jgi:hypothetical protein
MTTADDEIQALVRSAFPRGSRKRVLALLDSYGVKPYERERTRVQRAILALAAGNEDKLREMVAVAKRDYRDVLFWAECPDEARVDTPEKRQRVRELFAKLGIPPPPGLDDA